jgi:ribosomal protein S18 acetylase RimI-like enzyme
VQDFYVADEFRGKGIAERLLQRLASVTRKRGGCYIRLAVDAQNFRAQAFYARAGIKHSDTEQIHAAYDTAFHALADADPDD